MKKKILTRILVATLILSVILGLTNRSRVETYTVTQWEVMEYFYSETGYTSDDLYRVEEINSASGEWVFERKDFDYYRGFEVRYRLNSDSSNELVEVVQILIPAATSSGGGGGGRRRRR